MDKNMQDDKTYMTESISPDENWVVIFEDNGETGYLYLGRWSNDNGFEGIVDHLWIYNQISPPIQECKDVFITWNSESTRAGLIVDNECWGIFDLKSQRKLNAPRQDNCITSIPYSSWENGLNKDDGEQLRLTE